MKNIYTFILLLFLFFLITIPSAEATLKRWDGGQGNNLWTGVNNWFPDGVPTSTDSVVLDHQYLSGNYTVILPNSLVIVSSLNIYPSSPLDSIFVTIPSTNNVAPNLRVTGIGYHAFRIGNRGRFNNYANTIYDAFKIDDLFNYGLLLDVGGYFYHSSVGTDTSLLRKLTANLNSTFEFDRPSGGYQNLIFNVNSQVKNVAFYNLIFSGTRAGMMSYGGTLANNWNLIIKGDLTVRNGASFGVVVGAGGQIRYVRIRGNINIVNTTNTLWFESAPVAFGWFTIFEGSTQQNINGNISFLDSVTINNPNGVIANNNFDVKTCASFPITSSNPLLKLQSGLLTTAGTGIVRILLTGTDKIVGHSSNSYVNGKLRRNIIGTGSYDFPVGTTTDYQLATLNLAAVTGVTNITAEFSTVNLGNIPTPLTELSNSYEELLDAGFWRITPNAAMTGGSYSLAAHEKGYSAGGAPYYTIVKRINDLNPWTLQGTFVSFNETINTISAQRSNFTSFSDFAIAHPPLPLPITLTAFDAYLFKKNQVKIDWACAVEINNDYFTVEKSKDGVVWEFLSQINGAKNSNMPSFYSAIDAKPFKNISYYRLKQTDLDGKQEYSVIKAVEVKETDASILKIYPNPSTSSIAISNLPLEINKIEILNAAGQLVYQSIISSSDESIDIRHLPIGLYYVKVGEDILSFIKQ